MATRHEHTLIAVVQFASLPLKFDMNSPVLSCPIDYSDARPMLIHGVTASTHTQAHQATPHLHVSVRSGSESHSLLSFQHPFQVRADMKSSPSVAHRHSPMPLHRLISALIVALSCLCLCKDISELPMHTDSNQHQLSPSPEHAFQSIAESQPSTLILRVFGQKKIAIHELERKLSITCPRPSVLDTCLSPMSVRSVDDDPFSSDEFHTQVAAVGEQLQTPMSTPPSTPTLDRFPTLPYKPHAQQVKEQEERHRLARTLCNCKSAKSSTFVEIDERLNLDVNERLSHCESEEKRLLSLYANAVEQLEDMRLTHGKKEHGALKELASPVFTCPHEIIVHSIHPKRQHKELRYSARALSLHFQSLHAHAAVAQARVAKLQYAALYNHLTTVQKRDMHEQIEQWHSDIRSAQIDQARLMVHMIDVHWLLKPAAIAAQTALQRVMTVQSKVCGAWECTMTNMIQYAVDIVKQLDRSLDAEWMHLRPTLLQSVHYSCRETGLDCELKHVEAPQAIAAPSEQSSQRPQAASIESDSESVLPQLIHRLEHRSLHVHDEMPLSPFTHNAMPITPFAHMSINNKHTAFPETSDRDMKLYLQASQQKPNRLAQTCKKLCRNFNCFHMCVRNHGSSHRRHRPSGRISARDYARGSEF